MLNRNKLVFILAGILFAISSISAQNNARISADELIYNFGTIGESDGLAVTYLRSKTQVTVRLSSRGSQHPAAVRSPNGPKSPSLRERPEK